MEQIIVGSGTELEVWIVFVGRYLVRGGLTSPKTIAGILLSKKNILLK